MRDPKLAHILVPFKKGFKKDAIMEKILSLQEDCQKHKMVIKVNLPLFLTAVRVLNN